jgi:septal ring factor EnvC (AmiA/AmiB activator)
MSIAAALALSAGCRSPQQDAYLIEQIRQMGDELNASRQQAADLQAQLDSLRVAVARQDTLLTRLAGMAGVPR